MNAVLYWLGIYLLGGLVFLASMHIKTRLKKIVKQSSSATKRREDAIVQLLIMLFWPLVVGMLVYEGLFNRPKPAQIYRTWIATPESLIETLTISSIEQQQIYSDPLNAVPPIPFGHLHDAWQRFCQTLQKNATNSGHSRSIHRKTRDWTISAEATSLRVMPLYGTGK